MPCLWVNVFGNLLVESSRCKFINSRRFSFYILVTKFPLGFLIIKIKIITITITILNVLADMVIIIPKLNHTLTLGIYFKLYN